VYRVPVDFNQLAPLLVDVYEKMFFAVDEIYFAAVPGQFLVGIISFDYN